MSTVVAALPTIQTQPFIVISNVTLQSVLVGDSYCQTPVQVHSSPSPPDLGLGLGVDFVFAKNGQSLRNRVAEPAQPGGRACATGTPTKIYHFQAY